MGRVVSGKREISTDQLNENAARGAQGLKAQGIREGDSVALFMRNDFAFFEVSLAAGMVGAYPVPVNWPHGFHLEFPLTTRGLRAAPLLQ